MAWTINQLFHANALFLNVYTIYRMLILAIPYTSQVFKKFDVGMLKYLTFWNLIIQAVFFLICTLNDWFGTNAVSPKKPPFIRKLKDFVHAAFAFPTSMFVASIFWSLYLIDRELVFPKALDPHFPLWLNHLMHTMIVVTIMIETIMAPRKYPKRSKGVISNVILMLVYLLWMLVVYQKSGAWVYPVFHVLNLPTRILFCLTMMVYSMLLYIIGETADNFFWGNEYIKHQKSHAKSK